MSTAHACMDAPAALCLLSIIPHLLLRLAGPGICLVLGTHHTLQQCTEP